MPNYRGTLPKILWGTGAGIPSPANFTATAAGLSGFGGFTMGQNYFCVVAAIVGGVESLPSNEASALITVPNDEILFTWGAVPGATGYVLYYGYSAGGQFERKAIGNVTTYTDTAAGYSPGAPVFNTLNVGYLLDNIKAGDQPRAGSAFDQTPSGVEDAWITGFDYTLECELRWIPQTNTATPLATGWDGATGVRAFLQWARQKNPVRLYPDASGATYIICYLQDPMQGFGDVEENGQRRLSIALRQSSVPFDGY